MPKRLGSKIYALVIGIDSYPNLPTLAGAVADADATAGFLTDDMWVPLDHIINLRNGSATREAIINAIVRLSTDARIERGDPIIIYFAGYGVSVHAPAGTGAERIQAICPYDQGMVKSDGQVYPIPDRTICALVNNLASKKGDNITLIFDACYSTLASSQRPDGSAESNTYRPRGAKIRMEIPDDIDAEFMANANEEALRLDIRDTRGAQPLFTDQASYVFLTACGFLGFAWEGGDRGVFTSALLEAFRANDVDSITYENLLASLPRLPYDQSPSCLGSHKSRILFNARVPTHRINFRPVEKDEKGNWVLQAGASAGVTSGSIWALYEAPTEKSVSLGTLLASTPKTSSTLLQPRVSEELGPVHDETKRLFACQVQAGIGHDMKVFFSPEADRLIHLGNSRADLWSTGASDEANTATNGFRHVIVQKQEEADMVVGVYHEHPWSVPEITFTPRESLEEKYPLPLLTKRVSATRDEVDVVLSKASGWNWTLKYENASAVSDPSISLQFFQLRRFRDLNENGVVRIHVNPDERLNYGIRLTNHIQRNLYVRVLYLDVPTFSILDLTPRSTASGRKSLRILERGECLIGDTNMGGPRISFGIAEPNKVEIGFLKVVWSTSPFELATWQERQTIAARDREIGDIWGTLVVKLVLYP